MSLSNVNSVPAINKLKDTIERFNTEASRQTKQLVILTWVIAALTLVMTVCVIIQVLPNK